MLGLQAENHLRKADQVVQITFRCQARAGQAKDTGQHLLGTGLAIAARNAYHRQIKTLPKRCRQIPQRPQGILDRNAGELLWQLMLLQPALLSQTDLHPGGGNRFKIAVSIETLSP